MFPERCKHIIMDFDTFNQDMSANYERGLKEGQHGFVHAFQKLVDSPFTGEDFGSEIRLFLADHGLVGQQCLFIQKLIMAAVGNRAGFKPINVGLQTRILEVPHGE